ncbi:hydroxyethylthiazole kinase [Lachnoclostridium sp. Marseille-P6806]|uniref:hydroxyethylthiazole kinase n=1 Tax=Lachnoclostridium sp. Marseille-P6806 TaxID=2364793 RepID=UPI001031BA1C|nr:hydroxyethylthiazole kinase [Lachnoclostridium sp. Marseille-P6806]
MKERRTNCGAEAPEAGEIAAHTVRRIREARPLIHILTNSVTVTDVVNAVLACGASAVCAEDPKESAELAALADGLLLNIGTPNDRRVEGMLRAADAANRKGIPVVLDPVGAGASEYRAQILRRLLADIRFACIRGNRSELAAIGGLMGVGGAAGGDAGREESAVPSRGVEASSPALADEELRALSRRLSCTLAVTGGTDRIVTGGEIALCSRGTPLLTRVTGSGCMLSAFIAAALAAGGNDVSSEERHRSVCDAVLTYDLAAETAEREMCLFGHIGTGTFRMYLIDALSR